MRWNIENTSNQAFPLSRSCAGLVSKLLWSDAFLITCSIHKIPTWYLSYNISYCAFALHRHPEGSEGGLVAQSNGATRWGKKIRIDTHTHISLHIWHSRSDSSSGCRRTSSSSMAMPVASALFGAAMAFVVYTYVRIFNRWQLSTMHHCWRYADWSMYKIHWTFWIVLYMCLLLYSDISSPSLTSFLPNFASVLITPLYLKTFEQSVRTFLNLKNTKHDGMWWVVWTRTLCRESLGIPTLMSFYLVTLRETNVWSLNWGSVLWSWVAFQLRTGLSRALHMSSCLYRPFFSNLTLHQPACTESADGGCKLAQANVWDVDRRGQASTLAYSNIEVHFDGFVKTAYRGSTVRQSLQKYQQKIILRVQGLNFFNTIDLFNHI